MIKLTKLLILLSLIINFSSSKNFQFSVIIAIYNTGKYLNDSIGSLFNQTIDFEKIQIILVNDGSSDQTEEICLIYKNKYPSNIIYIKTEHNGVSFARNVGIDYAKGKFINFLDADDKWDKHAFHYVLLFFQYYRNINIVSCRMILFEGKNNYHPLDYKFYKSRVVKLNEEYDCILLSAASSFFRFSFIKNIKFKKGVFNGEDTRFINSLLLLNPLYGLIKEAIYFYRKRADSTSAVQNSEKTEEYYFSILNLVNKFLIEKSIELYNKIIPFIQFYLGYNMLFRISFPTYKYLEKNKLNKYYEAFEKILMQIEDKYILNKKYYHSKKNFLLYQKNIIMI